MPYAQFVGKALGVGLLAVAGAAAAAAAAPQPAPGRDAAAQILAADAAFAQSVADRDRTRFLSFLSDVPIFNGGTPGEVHGRDAVLRAWNQFFEPGGPTLRWTPSAGQVIGAGDLGFTTGQSVLRDTDASGRAVERRGEYLTVWRRQPDGSWKVVYDTGSTLPAAR